MTLLLFIYALALFFVLTPNVLVKLPMKGSKYVVAAVHALIFALIWVLTYRFVAPSTRSEGMTPSTTPSTNANANNYNVDILTALLSGYKAGNQKAVNSINAIMADPAVQTQIQNYITEHPIPGGTSQVGAGTKVGTGSVATAVKAAVTASPPASAKVAAVKATK